MEAIIFLVVLFLLAVLVVLPIWTLTSLGGLRDRHTELQQRLSRLEVDLQALRSAAEHPPKAEPARSEKSAVPANAPAALAPPPPLPTQVEDAIPPSLPRQAAPPEAAVPPPLQAGPGRPAAASAASPSLPVRPAINWEQFMGAKLFAWLGGLALFLGVAYFVKYSLDHGWIPDSVRVALGFLTGAGLVVGGLNISRERYAITAQTLIAAGIVSLYAVAVACSPGHFDFLPPGAVLLLMSLITTAAFFLAVRLNAQVVAVLGILGGFLTPWLLSTGVDNPGGLFGYLALLDLGLVAVALHRRWFHLVPLGAAGTVIMMVGWAGKFYAPEKTVTAMTVCLVFCAIYLAAYLVARRMDRCTPPVLWSAVAMPAVALAFALFFQNHAGAGARPALLFPFILAGDAVLLALAWLDDRLPRLHLVAGLAVFALLSIWTARHLTTELLPWALGVDVVFAGMHGAFPLLLERRRPAAAPTWWSQLFPPLALLLMLFPIFQLAAVSLLVWPAILLVDVLAIGLAALGASLTAVVAVLVLTLLATGLCVLRVPVTVVFAPSLLFVIGGFSVFFFAASLWLMRRLGDRLPDAGRRFTSVFGDARTQLPAFSSLLPFLLLIMICGRLAVPDPSAVFGLGLLLVALTLGLARLLAVEWLPACALAGMAALEYVWHVRNFDPAQAAGPLVWYVGIYLVFAAYPFLFRRQFARLTGPWAVAALSGVAHFWMVSQAIKQGWPNDIPGLVPALFAIAPIGSLFAILRLEPVENPKRINQLAWLGGAALFFITLIFPIQFERQWLTVAWALEGAALLWLFHRVPHPGLRAVGAVLLVIAFVRLALNFGVLAYHPRSDTAIFNWYLYAYGIAIAALFAGARLLAPPRARVLGLDAPPLLNALGVILAFLLLNIEIADYFTPPGARVLTFQFSGDFARDMSYTIAWALFALGLLITGIWRRSRTARYAAIALLSVALLKLFLHDLARLEALYRVGALIAVAVVAILASFAYQRFLPGNEKISPTQP